MAPKRVELPVLEYARPSTVRPPSRFWPAVGALACTFGLLLALGPLSLGFGGIWYALTSAPDPDKATDLGGAALATTIGATLCYFSFKWLSLALRRLRGR